jgi:hypothetical protein
MEHLSVKLFTHIEACVAQISQKGLPRGDQSPILCHQQHAQCADDRQL